MSSCDCYSCMNRIRSLEAKLDDLEHRFAQLKYDLEREVDDRRDAVRMLGNDIADATWADRP